MPETSDGSSASSAGSAWDEVTPGRDAAADEDCAVATAEGAELDWAEGAEDAAAGEAPAAFDGGFEALLPQPARTRAISALAMETNTRLATLLLTFNFI